MNTNRTKYASTPTYGMSKRGFTKKSNIPQAPAEPDFSQTPEQPVVPYAVAPNPFQVPQNVLSSNAQPPCRRLFRSPLLRKTPALIRRSTPRSFRPCRPQAAFCRPCLSLQAMPLRPILRRAFRPWAAPRAFNPSAICSSPP